MWMLVAASVAVRRHRPWSLSRSRASRREIPDRSRRSTAFGRELRPALIRVRARQPTPHRARHRPALTTAAAAGTLRAARELGSHHEPRPRGDPRHPASWRCSSSGRNGCPRSAGRSAAAMRELRKMQDTVKQRARHGDARRPPRYDQPVSADCPRPRAVGRHDAGRSTPSPDDREPDAHRPADARRLRRRRARRAASTAPPARSAEPAPTYMADEGGNDRRPDDARSSTSSSCAHRDLHLRDRGRGRARSSCSSSSRTILELPRGPVPGRDRRAATAAAARRLRPDRHRSARAVPRAAQGRGLRRARARDARSSCGRSGASSCPALQPEREGATRSRSSSRSVVLFAAGLRRGVVHGRQGARVPARSIGRRRDPAVHRRPTST